jgi:hypothetical protein
MGGTTQVETLMIGRESLDPQDFERRLNRLFEAAEGPRQGPREKGAVRWFAEQPLVDLSRRQVYNYVRGRTEIPDRIVAVLELLEKQHDVEGRSEP